MVREVAAAAGRVTRPVGGLVFMSGGLAHQLAVTAEHLAEVELGFPLLVVGGAGVLSDQGEIEGESAGTAIVWTGGRTSVAAGSTATSTEGHDALFRRLSDGHTRRPASLLLFARPQMLPSTALVRIADATSVPCVVGAGSVGEQDLCAVDAKGQIHTGPAVAMAVGGLSTPTVVPSLACRLVTPLAPITTVDGSVVLGVGRSTALELLQAVTRTTGRSHLILAALAEPQPATTSHPEVVIRGIRGVDTSRGGLAVSDEVRPGMLFGLAVRDADASRTNLQQSVREARRAAAGAAPRFALFFNCASRGSSLYGAPDVDTRILRSAFPGLPFAGMQSSFEIGPVGGQPTLQLFSGVVALFTAPS
jgi:small ligand-binding sensory domain FIST